jgi:hypothetical protein
MITGEINDFASRLVASIGDQLETITFYTHPFTNGGLVIVPKDDVEFIPDLISEIYSCQPPAITLNCLRRSELFQLSETGIFGWPYPLDERPHLAFWLKNQGIVLFGRDIREEIKLPETSSFLEIHLQRVKHCIRNWSFDQLWLKNYKKMVNEMERQSKYLMATALLTENEWDLVPEAIPERFDQTFKNDGANQAWADITTLARQTDDLDETTTRQSALEALWLFEQFMSQVGECKR